MLATLKISGDGPSSAPAMQSPQGRLGFNENSRKELTAEDIRFTATGKTLYAFAMGWPAGEVTVKPLASNNLQQPGNAFRETLRSRRDAEDWLA